MAARRSQRRNVHLYTAAEPDRLLGGLRLHSSVTTKSFLVMLDILIVADCPYNVILRNSGVALTATDEPLRPGIYDLKPDSPVGVISVTDEPCILRVLSHTESGRDRQFRQMVRERDGKCVITGLVNTDADIGDWTIFETAHIFPLSHGEYFRNQGFSRWVTNKRSQDDTGINSCQNGLLMQSSVHQLFDGFKFSINPDDNYKITSFDSDLLGLDGRTLDPVCRNPNDERRVSDELLRWHFRQAVLANMRGAGEPVFEFDFPPGTDMVGEIRSGPEPAKRMEAELFSRLDGIYHTA
ncbi:HNH endonuclease-domain-containing protein [Lipomyces kononenkoae]|uniref:HNH endonuclease-domain-containing protein n=1 Tax=Lipomyces kononenkoae TaxID=34357 RepID=A0ACC3SUK8_LIPKO